MSARRLVFAAVSCSLVALAGGAAPPAAAPDVPVARPVVKEVTDYEDFAGRLEPAQQADALYLLAQAKIAGANSTDPNQLKDAALAFMRAAAVCKSMQGQPHVAESLLQVAAIEEKLKNTKEALALYNQVAAEFKGSPAAAQAQSAAERLTPKG